MVWTIDILLVVQLLVLGLVAGMLGGLLGVGGSTIVIPGLTFVLGYNQHLYQAAAMIANVAVSVPAAIRHRRAGAMKAAVLRWMLPSALVFVLVGVWLSNRSVFRGVDGGLWLGRLLAVFLVYVIGVNIHRLVHSHDQEALDKTPAGRASSIALKARASRGCAHRQTTRMQRVGGTAALAGVIMGLVAGMLGIGGGAVAVPLQQVVLRLPLRSCIANSSAVICLSAAVGAIYKNASLAEHGCDWQRSLILALVLAPVCWVGGYLGACLSHRLPVRQVRVAFIGLMCVAAIKMAAIL